MKKLLMVSSLALVGFFGIAQAKGKDNGLSAKEIQECREECTELGQRIALADSNNANQCICESGADGETANEKSIRP